MDCLVTKLKEVVDDSRLLKMDEMEFVLSAGNMHIDLEVIGGGTATLIGDGYFTDSSYTQNNGKTLSLKSSGINNMYFKCNSECYLHTPKYSVKWVNIQSYAYIQGGIETLTFSDSLIVLYGGTSYGDIKCLKGKNLQQLSIPVDRYTGDIANLADSVSLTNLNATNSKIYGNISSLAGASQLATCLLAYTQVEGDISSLAEISTLKTLTLVGTKVSGDITTLKHVTSVRAAAGMTGNVANLSAPVELLGITGTGVTGTIESFVAKQRESGRTTGSCNNGGSDWGNLTFKGEPIGLGDDTLTWTATTIRCKGEQITA